MTEVFTDSYLSNEALYSFAGERVPLSADEKWHSLGNREPIAEETGIHGTTLEAVVSPDPYAFGNEKVAVLDVSGADVAEGQRTLLTKNGVQVLPAEATRAVALLDAEGNITGNFIPLSPEDTLKIDNQTIAKLRGEVTEDKPSLPGESALWLGVSEKGGLFAKRAEDAIFEPEVRAGTRIPEEDSQAEQRFNNLQRLLASSALGGALRNATYEDALNDFPPSYETFAPRSYIPESPEVKAQKTKDEAFEARQAEIKAARQKKVNAVYTAPSETGRITLEDTANSVENDGGARLVAEKVVNQELKNADGYGPRAFRKAATRLHPDTPENAGDSDATKALKRDALTVLVDNSADIKAHVTETKAKAA